MSKNELHAASDALREASEAAATEALGERLRERSETLATLADKDRKPDHGRLAREDSILVETMEDADASEEVRDHVEEARENIKEFRKDIPGV